MTIRPDGEMVAMNNNQTSTFPTLKFGIDRILSQAHSTKNLSNFECSVSEKGIEISSTEPPCAGCISSVGLIRCCSPTYSYRRTIHAPQPLRPYANIVTQSDPITTSTGHSHKRKRSWSRAVFSNLQRKGLEKRFQLQKYITKPDRRQLAATLGLTDAQVKVWFQNRRMKWRHTKESLTIKSTEESDENGKVGSPCFHKDAVISSGECNTDEEDIDVQT